MSIYYFHSVSILFHSVPIMKFHIASFLMKWVRSSLYHRIEGELVLQPLLSGFDCKSFKGSLGEESSPVVSWASSTLIQERGFPVVSLFVVSLLDCFSGIKAQTPCPIVLYNFFGQAVFSKGIRRRSWPQCNCHSLNRDILNTKKRMNYSIKNL